LEYFSDKGDFLTFKISKVPKTLAEGRKLLEEDETLKRIVEVIVEVLNPDRIILFGSRARGDHNEDSDYDILVLKEGVKPEERRRLQRILRDALWNWGIAHVDIIVQSPERFVKLENRWDMVYWYIRREGIVIYEKG